MLKLFYKVFVSVLLIYCNNILCVSSADDSIIFTVYNNLTGEIFNSTFDQSLSGLGCDKNGKIAIIVHGWREDINASWVPDLISNLSYYRGGCIMFVDYSYYSMIPFYRIFFNHFSHISNVILNKLKQLEEEGFDPDNIYMFGYSFGARLVIDAAAEFGHQRIDQIDACEPAGPGFNLSPLTKDPKKAAKNVQCIHTSANLGTRVYNCHQDWLMGICGKTQVASNHWNWRYCQRFKTCDPVIYYNHGLCPHFYNSAFKNDFIANNQYNCRSTSPAKNLPRNFKMGYMETRRSKLLVGEIFAPTAELSPWNIV